MKYYNGSSAVAQCPHQHHAAAAATPTPASAQCQQKNLHEEMHTTVAAVAQVPSQAAATKQGSHSDAAAPPTAQTV
jgi:hypothetical protein